MVDPRPIIYVQITSTPPPSQFYDYPIRGSFVKLGRSEELFAVQRASLDHSAKRIGN